MDLKFLDESLASSVERYHLNPNVRYRNIAFSSSDLAVLDDITQSLRRLLPQYCLWESPRILTAPDSNISRRELINSIKSFTHKGLIIKHPAQWLNHWQQGDKQAFWSTIAMLHNCTKVIIVFAAGSDFQQINSSYYNFYTLDGLPIKLWLPARAEQPE